MSFGNNASILRKPAFLSLAPQNIKQQGISLQARIILTPNEKPKC